MARLPWDPSPYTQDGIVLDPPPDVPAAQKICDVVGRVSHLTTSAFTILPSVYFRTIPRPLRVPLSLIPPEHMQVSGICENDLDMSLYVFFGPQIFTGRRD